MTYEPDLMRLSNPLLRYWLATRPAFLAASLIPVLHYDGTPITARFITREIAERVSRLNVRPLREDRVA